MVERLLKFALHRRAFVLALSMAMMAYGFLASSRLPVDVFPDLNRPTVTIMTEAEGLAPEEVETLVTFPIETAMNGSTGVQRVRSNSAVGLSIVFVEFDWNMDIQRARQLVGEKLQTAMDQLPAGVTPHMTPISSIMGEIMLVGIYSTDPSRSPMDIRTITDWDLRPRLLAVPGVSQVTVIGGGRKQVQVQVDPARLQAQNLSLEDVAKAAENANRNSTGGFIEHSAQEWLVRNMGRIDQLADLENSVVAYRDGSPVLLGSVAKVGLGRQPMRGDAGINGLPAVILSVQKQPHADSIALTGEIQNALNEIRQNLPQDIKINDQLFLQADFIKAAITNVRSAMVEAAILVSIVLILFLMNWRTTVVTLVALPASFLLSALVFEWAGLSVNTMTLGGLAVAIGELVDDAIVDVENIQRRLRENLEAGCPRSVIAVVYGASVEVRSCIVYSTVMMCVTFIPLFQMGGLEGRMFLPMGVAYIIAILCSLLISLTVTPALASLLLGGKAGGSRYGGDTYLVRLLKWINGWQLSWSLRHPSIIMAVFYAVALVCIFLFTQFGRQFLPPFNEGTMTVSVFALPGTSLEESNRLGQKAERLLLGVPEVTWTGRRTGRAELDEHAEGVHASEIEVHLKPGRGRAEIFEDVRSRLKALSGVMINVGQPISHRLDHMLSGVNAEIAVKIFGPDLGQLRQQAGRVRDAMAQVPGVVDLFVEQQSSIPQLRVQILRSEAARYGVQTGDLARTLEAALYGVQVSEVIDGPRRYDMVVKLAEESRGSARAIGDVLVDTSHGAKVPLRAVADIIESDGPNLISRENVQRRIVVQANAAGRDVGSVVDEIRTRLSMDIQPNLPKGTYLRIEGQFQAQQKAARTIAILSIVSLAFMYVLLYQMFPAHRVVFCILMNVPLAMIGAVLAVAFHGHTFSIASLMGFLTLMGVCLRNGMLLIEHYVSLVAEEGRELSLDTIVHGTQQRLVPVLMTAATSLLAMVPFVFSAAGSPGKEILDPMALVIFAGTLSSTLLAVSYTPAFFWHWCRPVVPRLVAARKADS